MPKRPLTVTIISWLFIAVGCIGFVYHLSRITQWRPFDYGLAGVCLIRLLAIVSGVFMLRGHNWARWLLVLWMAWHIVLSAFHSPLELVLHILLFGTIGYFLFRPRVSAYFRRTKNANEPFP